MKRKFSEIAEELQKMIDRGEYTDRLPSEQELAQQFNTASATIRKSLDILLARGIIRKVPYVGTFIQRESRKKVRLAWTRIQFCPEGDRDIREAVTNHFKDFDVEFVSDFSTSEIRDCDLIRSVATAALSFSESVLPLPLEFTAKYPNDDYFNEPFKAHQINNFHYAMPILFSPSLMILDCEKVAGFGRPIGPYDLTWDTVMELARYARENNIPLFGEREIVNLCRCLVYSDTPNGILTEIDVKKLKQKIHKFWPLLSEPIASLEERKLLTWSCRQSLPEQFRRRKYQMLVNPVFHAGEKSRNLITGEFLLISNRTKMFPEAVAVMEYMLGPEVQRLIARHKMGLPVLKSAAVDSINSRYYRDDIFLNETPNMLVNNASEQEFLLRLDAFSKSILNGEMTEEQFISYLEYEIDMAHRKAAENNNDIFMELAGV